MKKSFTLIEVIIAVSLLSIVITTSLQIRQNNLSFLEKYQSSSLYNEYISLASSYDLKDTLDVNTHIYLDEIVNFKNDDIRKEFKDIKVYIKNEIINTIDLSTDDLSLNINIIQNNFKIEDKINKNFYTFKLEY